MASRLPPMHCLQALEAFSRLGSVWKAAEELDITRSAVSHRIAYLEEIVGFPILERSGKGAALTRRGRRYADETAQWLKRLKELHGRLDQVEGRLRVSSAPGFAGMWLCTQITTFLDQHPGLDLEIATRHSLADISSALDADVFIVFGEGKWPDFVIQELYPVAYVPLCSPSLLNRYGAIQCPADLLRQPLLHLLARDDWARWFELNGVDVPDGVPGIVFSDMLLVQSAAISGQGVMLGDTMTCAQALTNGTLVRSCPLSVSAPSYYVLYRRRDRRNAAVQAFVSWLQALIAQSAPSVEPPFTMARQ